MKKIKISVVTGTRAEYGLLRPILFEFKKRNNVNFSLIVTGSHLSKEHGMTINEIKNDGFKIHSKFSWNTSDDSLSNSSIMLGKSQLMFMAEATQQDTQVEPNSITPKIN